MAWTGVASRLLSCSASPKQICFHPTCRLSLAIWFRVCLLHLAPLRITRVRAPSRGGAALSASWQTPVCCASDHVRPSE
eukprot:5602702-Pleurochrysis_carterae.AAC.1